MKLKTLKKKIRRLETRLLEGPKKLAKLKGKLGALVNANAAKARKKAAATRKKNRGTTAKSQAKSTSAKGSAPKKAKRKLNLSPERREQLAAAMRARWAAKRAAEGTSPDSSANHDFTIGPVPQSP
jgi:chromosome segregation ATPase